MRGLKKTRRPTLSASHSRVGLPPSLRARSACPHPSPTNLLACLSHHHSTAPPHTPTLRQPQPQKNRLAATRPRFSARLGSLLAPPTTAAAAPTATIAAAAPSSRRRRAAAGRRRRHAEQLQPQAGRVGLQPGQPPGAPRNAHEDERGQQRHACGQAEAAAAAAGRHQAGIKSLPAGAPPTSIMPPLMPRSTTNPTRQAHRAARGWSAACWRRTAAAAPG